MGFFGKFAYSAGRWSTGAPTAVPFLLIDVHDSDLATVDYRAADASGGRFFLGYEPRIYFEEPDGADPVDTHAEAEGFARWAREAGGTEVDPVEVQRLMASPDGAPPEDEVVEETSGSCSPSPGCPQSSGPPTTTPRPASSRNRSRRLRPAWPCRPVGDGAGQQDRAEQEEPDQRVTTLAATSVGQCMPR